MFSLFQKLEPFEGVEEVKILNYGHLLSLPLYALMPSRASFVFSSRNILDILYVSCSAYHLLPMWGASFPLM